MTGRSMQVSAVSLIVVALVIGGWLAAKVRQAGWPDKTPGPEGVSIRRRRFGGLRCPTCRAAVIEEDSRFCPRCGARLGIAAGS